MGIFKDAIVRGHIRYNRMRYGIPDRYQRLLQLIERQRPKTILEIGTWRGRNARRMFERALAVSAEPPMYFGFDLFETADAALIEEEVGKMPPSQAEVLEELKPWRDRGVRIALYAGNTRETLPRAAADLPPIDFAFIDGGHSYETVKSDWEQVTRLVHGESLILLDDYVNAEAARAENWGVNRLVEEIDPQAYRVELLTPTDWWPKPYGFLKNRLVLATPRRASAADPHP